MDIETRKLNLIEFILKLKDKKAFNAIENAIDIVTKSSDKELRQFTTDELISRAEESNADYKSGKVKTQDQLENESENW